MLSEFFIHSRKRSGDEYEPDSLTGFQRSIQQWLTEEKSKTVILKDEVLAAKKRETACQCRKRQQTKRYQKPSLTRTKNNCLHQASWEIPLQIFFKGMSGGSWHFISIFRLETKAASFCGATLSLSKTHKMAASFLFGLQREEPRQREVKRMAIREPSSPRPLKLRTNKDDRWGFISYSEASVPQR